MPEIKILTEADLRELVPLDMAAVDCVENGFAALAGGKVVMPPILSMPIHDANGEIDVKTAYVPGLPSFAVKMSPGFFDNPKIGLPSTAGLMVVFSATTGQLGALLLDNGYLTNVRTAAAGAVAARHLSRENARSAAIFGTGEQARLQLHALCLVRGIERAQIWGRDPAKAIATAAELSEQLGIEVSAQSDAETAVADADVIITTTPSSTPVLRADWLRAGQHITAMGSDQEHKAELDPACLNRADIYVPDRQSQTSLMGELRAAIEVGLIPPDRRFDELGDVVNDRSKGRHSADQITIADLTGTGVQDTAIATLAHQRAIAAAKGTPFTSQSEP